jgi:hypothetical protein
MFKGLIKSLFPNSGDGSGVGDQLGGLVDRFVHTKDEKAAFEKEMSEILFSAQDKEQSHTTKRWEVDMSSDSWLSKNVRPIMLIAFFCLILLLVVLDSSGTVAFVVADRWVTLIEMLGLTIFGAYFGDRAIRGYQSVKNKGK